MQIIENIYALGGAYLVVGEKTALVDTVARGEEDALIRNIEKITNNLDYVVLNHTEPDKSYGLGAVLGRYPNAEVIATVAGIRNLKEMLSCTFKERAAKDNAVLDLGNGITLRFIITPNLNWPDSMVTYEENAGTLFSCDLFSSGAEKYLMTYPDYVQNALTRLSDLNITAVMTGSDDILIGAEITKTFDKYNRLLKEYRANEQAKTVLILYSSVYGATREMAEYIHAELKNAGVNVKMCDAETDELPDINSVSALIVGCGTYENGAAKSVMRVLCNVNASRMRHKPFFTFGSYGWSGEGAEILYRMLQSLGMKPFSKPFLSIFGMNDETKERLIRHTRKFAQFILE